MGHHAREPAAQRRSPHVVATSAPPVPLPLGGVGNRALQSLLGAGEAEGRPLDPVLRRQLEAQLGTDLGRVRVHSGPAAATAADALAAKAYTVGHDVVFAFGEYRPHDATGRSLLVHELTHVRQQARGGTALAGSPDAERAAKEAADRLAAGDSPPAIAGTAPGVARQPKEGAGSPTPEADDSLGDVGEAVVNLVSHGMAGTGLQQRMLQAAMRGFVAELGRQLKPGEQAARFKSSLKELAVPGNLARFAGGYAGGAVAGLVSPVTDLLGLGALVEQLPAIATNLGRRAWQQASVLADEARELAKNVAEFTVFAKGKLAELLRDPAQLYALLDSVGPKAVTAAGEAGRSAARQIVGFFTSKDEQEEKPDESLRQALTTTTEAEKSGFFSFLTSKATRLRKLAFSTPWAKFGYDVGHAVGAVVSNLLLLVFSEGIGNAIAKIGSWLGEVAPLLARGAKGLVQLGRVVEAAEQAVGLAISKGLKLARPLEAIVAPLLRLFERFQGFLRRLFGVAEREAATLAARGGAAAAEEAGARMARPPAAAAEVVPIKGPSKPPVSELTRSQQAKLGRAPKGSRGVSEIHPQRPAASRPVAAEEPLPEVAVPEEPVALAATGTEDVVPAGGPSGAPRAMAATSGPRKPPGPRTPSPRPVVGSSVTPKRAAEGTGLPSATRTTPAPPKAPPQVRGATATVERGPVKPAPRPAPRPAAEPARTAPTGTEASTLDEEVHELFAAEQERFSPEERVLGGVEHEGEELVVRSTPDELALGASSASDEMAAAMALERNPRPPGHDTHHIVADADPRAQEARDILEKAGINPRNDPRNGIHLPRTTMDPRTRPEAFTRHQTIHTESYYETVNQRIRDAWAGRLKNRPVILDPKLRVEDELARLYQEIANGQLPHPKLRD
jgi:hypothetical protein